MSPTETLALIAELQRAKRRWKLLAIGLLAMLVIVVLGGTGVAFLAWRVIDAEEVTAKEARRIAEQIREEPGRAKQRASSDAGSGDEPQPTEIQPTNSGTLPDISIFQAHPCDRFLVDLDDFTSGHPFKGINSAQPHAGAHINFDNSDNRWPKGGTAPANYPAIYAVAGGFVSRVDHRFGLRGGNDRYGVDLTFAVDAKGNKCQLCYSIEPMIPEPSEGFYRKFLTVSQGQKVRKGDVLAYMYCPPGVKDVHIHFHLMVEGRNGFLAPGMFSPDVVKDFHAKWGGFGKDDGTPMPPCMGYRIGAEENPFGTGAKEQL
jgi:hypothetical protein